MLPVLCCLVLENRAKMQALGCMKIQLPHVMPFSLPHEDQKLTLSSGLASTWQESRVSVKNQTKKGQAALTQTKNQGQAALTQTKKRTRCLNPNKKGQAALPSSASSRQSSRAFCTAKPITFSKPGRRSASLVSIKVPSSAKALALRAASLQCTSKCVSLGSPYIPSGTS